MKTQVLKIKDSSKDLKSLLLAASAIKDGDLVVMPTETVYGLGADATNPTAVRKIVSVKNRPADNPLIIHVSNSNQIHDLVKEVTPSAQKIIDHFWPGPISMVLNKNPDLNDVVTAGLDTVVVRQPDHEVARKLIELAGVPIAAPSANTSGKISPTKSEHVLEDLDGKVPIVLDVDNITYGLESTVVDCTGDTSVILRPGSVTTEELKEVLPDIKIESTDCKSKSPGTKYKHYAPDITLTLVESEGMDLEKYLKDKDINHTAVIWHEGDFHDLPHNIRIPVNPYEAAPLLFETLRSADHLPVKEIVIQGFPDTHVGVAIMNRLRKAASRII